MIILTLMIQFTVFAIALSPIWLLIAAAAAVFLAKSRKARILGLVLVCFFGVLSAGEAWLVYEFRKGVAEVTDPGQYQEVLNNRLAPQLQPADAMAFFPISIPRHATGVQMYYLPHFLQGGNIFQIRYHLPADELKAAVAAATARAPTTTQPFDPDFGEVNFRNDANTDFGGDLSKDFVIHPVHFWVRNSPSPPILEDYDTGIAVSEKKQEIIYWYRDCLSY